MTSFANVFSSMRSQTLNSQWPPGENPSHLTIGAIAVGKKHHAKLTADDIEGQIVERQGPTHLSAAR